MGPARRKRRAPPAGTNSINNSPARRRKRGRAATATKNSSGPARSEAQRGPRAITATQNRQGAVPPLRGGPGGAIRRSRKRRSGGPKAGGPAGRDATAQQWRNAHKRRGPLKACRAPPSPGNPARKQNPHRHDKQTPGDREERKGPMGGQEPRQQQAGGKALIAPTASALRAAGPEGSPLPPRYNRFPEGPRAGTRGEGKGGVAQFYCARGGKGRARRNGGKRAGLMRIDRKTLFFDKDPTRPDI